MKVFFYLISLIPKGIIIIMIDIYIYTKIYKVFNAYKVTKVNLKIAYPDLNNDTIEALSKLSIRESLISVYETFYTWGSSHISSCSKIFKVNSQCLFTFFKFFFDFFYAEVVTFIIIFFCKFVGHFFICNSGISGQACNVCFYQKGHKYVFMLSGYDGLQEASLNKIFQMHPQLYTHIVIS